MTNSLLLLEPGWLVGEVKGKFVFLAISPVDYFQFPHQHHWRGFYSGDFERNRDLDLTGPVLPPLCNSVFWRFASSRKNICDIFISPSRKNRNARVL